MISLLEPSCGTGDNPQPIEHLQNYYAYIMRDSKGIMDSGEAIFTAQAQVAFFFIMRRLRETLQSHSPPLTTIVYRFFSIPDVLAYLIWAYLVF